MFEASFLRDLANWALLAPFAGLGISLLAATRLEPGPRRRISLVMLVLAVLSLGLFLHNPLVSYEAKWRHAENVGFSLLMLVLFLQLLAMIYWPVRSAWVNRPVLIGLAICFLAGVVLSFVEWW